jgi:hypothetical protein
LHLKKAKKKKKKKRKKEKLQRSSPRMSDKLPLRWNARQASS